VRNLIVAVTTLVALGAAAPAWAGHYRLPVENLITVEESGALSKAGIQTTLALLEQIARVGPRKAIAAKTGLTYVRLSTLAAQADLLRVEGVGPSMVLLLQAAGVRHTRDLGAADPAALRDKMAVANGVHNISPVVPQEDVVRSWIQHARGLPQIVEGLN